MPCSFLFLMNKYFQICLIYFLKKFQIDKIESISIKKKLLSIQFLSI